MYVLFKQNTKIKQKFHPKPTLSAENADLSKAFKFKEKNNNNNDLRKKYLKLYVIVKK